MSNWTMDLWYEVYQEKHGFAPRVAGRDAAIFSRILAQYPDEAAFRWAVRAYHSRSWDWKAIRESGYDSRLFEKQYGGLYFAYMSHRVARASERKKAAQAATSEASGRVLSLVDRLAERMRFPDDSGVGE